jgi:hypothetical protein
VRTDKLPVEPNVEATVGPSIKCVAASGEGRYDDDKPKPDDRIHGGATVIADPR